MTREIRRIDVSDMPELRALAQRVRAAQEAHVLRVAGEDLAIVAPLPRRRLRRRRARSEQDIAAFQASAGSWADVDADGLIADIYATRDRTNRPPPWRPRSPGALPID